MLKRLFKNLVLRKFRQESEVADQIFMQDLNVASGTYHIGLRREGDKIKYYLDISGDLNSLPRTNQIAITQLRDDLTTMLESNNSGRNAGGLIC